MLQLAREEDWEAVKRLSVQIHDLHATFRNDIYYHTDEPYPREKYLEDIAQRLVYVAKIDSDIVGYVRLSLQEKEGPGTVFHKLMRLDSICVDESIRCHGAGKEMLTDVRALARVFGCDGLILGVHPENDDAVVFYQKCGFTIRTICMEMKI